MSLPATAQPLGFVITADRSRSKPFYANVLGLRVLGEDEHAVTFDLGNRTPMRLTTVDGYQAAGHTVLGWHVSDIAATVAALKAKGVAFKIYEGYDQGPDAIWRSPQGGSAVAWFADPDGNLLSLTQFG
ncbi:VOC family protein [Novosphingobium sp.]|uniref:VOC family protein n=1 Tax=Novosphingobium sp. TaxID=1874826 RepID=UPI0025F77E0D|nr:VOC family protein [Novosphingobium sp.]